MTALMARDSIALLTSKGPLATKRIIRDPGGGPVRIEPYGRAKRFSIDVLPVGSLDELAAILESVGPQPRCFVVRGLPAEGIDRRNAYRRLHARQNEPATLEPAAHHWLLVDVDSLHRPDWLDPVDDPDHAVEYVVSHLPPEFHGATCWWLLTAGQGFKPGICIRLAFWLDREVSDAELGQWLDGAPIDHSIFRPYQPIYVARPVFEGLSDPLPHRSGIWRGDRDAVTPPPVIVQPPCAGEPQVARARGKAGGVPGIEGLHASGSYGAYRGQIGDHRGGGGFYRPIQRAIGVYFWANGPEGDTEWLKNDLEAAIRAAYRNPAKHDTGYVEDRVRDLPGWIDWTRRQEEAKPAEAESEAEPEPAVEPTYPAPLGSVAEARAVSGADGAEVCRGGQQRSARPAACPGSFSGGRAGQDTGRARGIVPAADRAGIARRPGGARAPAGRPICARPDARRHHRQGLSRSRR